MEKMPEWPNKDETNRLVDDQAKDLHPAFRLVAGNLAYEGMMAKAAMARLRLAVEALENIKNQERFDEDGIYYRLACVADCVERADKALAAIGELPEKP